MRDKDTRQCPQTTTFEVKGEPKRIRTKVPLLTSLSLTARPHRLMPLFVDYPFYRLLNSDHILKS